MGFFTWLRRRTSSQTKRAARGFRPQLEVLEDRAVTATLTVNTTLDVLGHDNGMLSLRQAIIDANATPKADTIILPAGTYTLTRPGAGEYQCLTGDLDISAPLTINGAGAGSTIIDANGLDRAIDVHSCTVTLSGMTIRGGSASSVVGQSSFLGEGGAILNSGTLTVTNCVISDNSASIGGGGLYNGGTLKVNNSVLSGNSAGHYGGGIYNYGGSHGTVTVINSTLSGNHAVNSGGAIWNDTYAAVTLQQGSTLSGNSAFIGGGIFNQSGTVNVSSCTFSSNSASFEGGAIYNAAPYYGSPTGTVTIQNNSTLTANSAARAGAIYNANGGKLTIDGSTLSNNTATYTGGGILDYGWLTVNGSNLTGNSAGQAGGGIMLGASYATVTVKNSSSITGNTAPAGFGADVDNLGVLYLDSTRRDTGSLNRLFNSSA
jgi:predicted outer membrane repeat protein